MFLSDNGGCTEEPGGRDDTKQPGLVSTYTAVGPAWGWAQNTPFRRYKSWVHEGGISTPFIARWPGHIRPNTLTNQLGHIIDVVPTCLDLAGGKHPAEINGQATSALEGSTLAPIFAGQDRPTPAQLCWEWSGNLAIRRGPHKLVWDTLSKPNRWELYNIETDRTDLHDLAPEKPQLVSDLATAYTTWAKTLNRRLPGQKSKNADD